MFCPKNETAVILTKVKIFSSDAAVVAAGSGQLERRQGVPTAQVTSEGPSTYPAGTTANHHGQKEKKE